MTVRAGLLAAALGVSGGAGTAAITHDDGLDGARQTAALALSVGLTPEQAVVATAVAEGESGHRDSAVGDTTITDGEWGPSYGRWQVRCLWAQVGTGQTRDCDRLNDGRFNARSMFEISAGGTNWRPWSVYTSGAWRAYLDDAQRAVGDVLGAGGVTVLAGLPVQRDRSFGRFASGIWGILVDAWESVGRTSNPTIREQWRTVDDRIFGSEDPAA